MTNVTFTETEEEKKARKKAMRRMLVKKLLGFVGTAIFIATQYKIVKKEWDRWDKIIFPPDLGYIDYKSYKTDSMEVTRRFYTKAKPGDLVKTATVFSVKDEKRQAVNTIVSDYYLGRTKKNEDMFLRQYLARVEYDRNKDVLEKSDIKGISVSIPTSAINPNTKDDVFLQHVHVYTNPHKGTAKIYPDEPPFEPKETISREVDPLSQLAKEESYYEKVNSLLFSYNFNAVTYLTAGAAMPSRFPEDPKLEKKIYNLQFGNQPQ